MNFNQLLKESVEEYDLLFECEDPVILIGSATCGKSAGAHEVADKFKETLEELHIDAEIVEVGCIGLCYLEPIVTIIKKGMPAIFYGEVTPKLAKKIVFNYIVGNDPMKENALGTFGKDNIEGIPELFNIPVMKPQVRKILRNCGFIDPKNIKHYIAKGGYIGLKNAIESKPEDVIDKMKLSGLRGRGGAGFPTWMKWQFCIDSGEDVKYLICNADEGDPGAFMNRSLLESDPHSVLEGIVIAAFAIGVKEGYIYCRAEYPSST